MSEYFNLNDLEYGNHITTILQEQAKLNDLSAQRKVGALKDCLGKIEDAARKAHWWLQRNAP